MRARSRAGTGALLVELGVGALLAVDNLLGFVGWHLLPPGAPLPLGSVGVLTGLGALAICALTRRVGDALMAASAIGFLSTLSPALGGGSSPLLPVVLQAAVPIGLALAAAVHLRVGGTTAERILGAAIVVLALAWAVAAFLPVWLVALLVVQALTLVIAASRTALPAARRLWNVLLELWSSAAIR